MGSKLFKKFLDQTQPVRASLSPRGPPEAQMTMSPSLNRSLRRSVSPETPQKQGQLPTERKDYQQAVEQALRNYYEAQLAELRQEFRLEMESVLKDHYEVLEAKDASYTQLQRDYEALKKEAQHLEEQLHAVEHRKVRQLRQERNKLEGETDELREDNKQLRRQVEHLKDDLQVTKNLHEEQERTLKLRVHDLERELRLAKDESASLLRKVDTVKDKAAGFQRKIELHKEKNRRLQEEVASAQQRRERVEAWPEPTPRVSFAPAEQHIPPRSESPAVRHSLPEQNFVRAKVGANVSLNMQSALCWTETPSQERGRSRNSAHPLENELYTLHMEKRTLENEYARLPERPKRASEINRREELENELNTVTHQIAIVKTKLRQAGIIH